MQPKSEIKRMFNSSIITLVIILLSLPMSIITGLPIPLVVIPAILAKWAVQDFLYREIHRFDLHGITAGILFIFVMDFFMTPKPLSLLYSVIIVNFVAMFVLGKLIEILKVWGPADKYALALVTGGVTYVYTSVYAIPLVLGSIVLAALGWMIFNKKNVPGITIMAIAYAIALGLVVVI